MESQRITSLAELVAAVDKKRALVCPSQRFFCNSRIPAAFVINMSGAIIHGLITSGLFIYTPKSKP